jgi:methylated-DNA-[protein]-cysteine S-methyltransferase
MKLHACSFDTRLTRMLAAVDAEGRVVRLDFLRGDDVKSALGNKLRELVSRGDEVQFVDEACAHVRNQVDEYLRGERLAFDWELAPHGTPFQHRVWQELQAIPYGRTASYRDIAEAIGNRNACRAVARANATNPISLAVPCHRVIGADGSLTGYGGGLDVKEALLAMERRALAASVQPR